MQEIALNSHHLCEQEGRYRASLFVLFNGTGGIWRRSAIEDVGGWHTDTVAEDLDLSFRAHAHGWRAVYLKDVLCQSELPPSLSAYFTQQHRWNCGRMQVGRKLLTIIVRSKYLTWYQKLYCKLVRPSNVDVCDLFSFTNTGCANRCLEINRNHQQFH